MRAADPNPTVPMHITLRMLRTPPSSTTAASHSSPNHNPDGVGTGGEGSDGAVGIVGNPNTTQRNMLGEARSYYLECSVDDNDLLVMRTMSDWSQGASGMSHTAPLPMVQRSQRSSRNLLLPQIQEANEVAEAAGSSAEVADSPQLPATHM